MIKTIKKINEVLSSAAIDEMFHGNYLLVGECSEVMTKARLIEYGKNIIEANPEELQGVVCNNVEEAQYLVENFMSEELYLLDGYVGERETP